MQFKDVITDPCSVPRSHGGAAATMRCEDHRNRGPALPRLYCQIALCSDCLGERPRADGYFP